MAAMSPFARSLALKTTAANWNAALAPFKGNVWYVDSTATAGAATEWSNAVITLDAAVNLASAGDTILVAELHAETITAAAAVDIDVAGLKIIGLGYGNRKPTITFGTATTATIKVNAAGVLLKNIRCVNNIDSLVKFIDVNADYATIEDCDFVTSSTKEATSFINLATTKDYLTVRGCRFEQPTDHAGTDGAADTGAIFCVDSEYVSVEDCWFSGNFETAIFHNRTTACKHLWVKNCHGIQALSGAEPFQLVAAATGGVYGGMFITPAEIAATEATLVGTIGDGFFVSPTTGFGNDGAAGGQGAIVVATAS